MSKIYNKYLELKHSDNQKLYLFHSGKFYIFIAEDADLINQYVVLKKTKFTKETYKCGFPDSCIDDYLRVFHNHGLKIEIIESSDLIEDLPKNNDKFIEKYKKIENKLKTVDINQITPIESLSILNEIIKVIYD